MRRAVLVLLLAGAAGARAQPSADVARGEAIVRNIAVCGGCHAADERNPDGPLSGGHEFRNWRVGVARASNLTPDDETGLGTWSEAEIVRAIRNGVRKDGRLLAPVMPYAWFSGMSDADAFAVARYLKSLPPMKNPVRQDFNLIFRIGSHLLLHPAPTRGPAAMAPAATAAYGGYLSQNVGLCGECHTPRGGLKDEADRSRLFAGSAPADFPANPSNLTPDVTTGIGNWSEEQFVQTIRTGVDPAGMHLHPFMPWHQNRRMADDDLRAIYRFLRTIPPIHNEVPDKHEQGGGEEHDHAATDHGDMHHGDMDHADMAHTAGASERAGQAAGTSTAREPAPMSMPMQSDATSELLMRQVSGTSMNPAAAPMHMSMASYGDWMVMLHGLAFVNQVMQTGPRGRDKLFSTNWLMGMADRPLGSGHLMLRSMLSLEPLTVGKQYPELFQTGETIGGRPIVDAQHPHDFFMELAAEYAHPLTDRTIGYVYVAPFGDPSLGPVAYPHRASASEIPQAALGHHTQDSTHIAGSVITVGAQSGAIGYAFSGFHGREPDENRWDIDTGRIDSWAARVTFDPAPQWTAQLSTGHLRRPEAAEPGNVQRTTASVSYSAETVLGRIDSSAVFGHNAKTVGHSTSSWLAESVLQFGRSNYVTGRGEIVDKDELFGNAPVAAYLAGPFHVRALTLGYSRDLVSSGPVVGAAGANVTLYSVPDALQPFYGNSPHSLYLFLRIRGGADHAAGAGHRM